MTTDSAQRVVLCSIAPNGTLIPLESFDDATKARKRVRSAKVGDFEPGEYAILAYLNKGIRVSPPPQTERLVVDLGETFITRQHTSSEAPSGEEAKEAEPTSKRGLFGRGD